MNIEEQEELGNDDQNNLPQSIHRSFNMQGLTSFPPFKLLLPYQTLTFSSNPIDSFGTLPSLPNLKYLDISETQISSFQYIQTQPLIESINIKNTPLSHYTETILMTVIAFGPTLKMINGSQIPQVIYKRGLKLRPYLLCYLYNGWILLSDNPIKVFNVNTRKRLVFLSLKSIPQIPMEKYKEERKKLSKTYASISLCSTSYRKRNNTTQNDNNNNSSNKIKKKVSNIRRDKISQSMPRIPTCRIRQQKSDVSEQCINKNENDTANRVHLSHRRNQSLDSKIIKNTKIRPSPGNNKSKSQKTPKPVNNTNDQNEDECVFTGTPIYIKRKRKSEPDSKSLSKITKELNIGTNKSLSKDSEIKKSQLTSQIDNKITEQINSVESTKKNRTVTFSQNPPKKQVNTNQQSTINDQKKNNQRASSNLVSKNPNSRTNHLYETAIIKQNTSKKESQKVKSKTSIDKALVSNSENVNIEQNNLCISNTEIKEDTEISDENQNELSEELETTTVKRTPKLYTHKLDHSNALNNLSSMKEVYKDLIFNIPISDVSETSDYVSDRDFDKQLEQLDFALPSDSTTTVDDF
ncbi:hypothetical protein M9Y10_017869 [Tritrichomonas musculus]|uniref:Leucine-rich repeat-containing protein n=1 Tax=Tritrichomonas musculus TaxID=1915356 RepID=A0ABR2HUU0_9EUKA